MHAENIDEVIAILATVVSEEREGPLGLFPALYRQVTIEVKRGIDEGFFDDAERMNRLDTAFANRYFDALTAFREGRDFSRSWAVAFGAAEESHLILQHLLLGVNAHINLDLGIAAGNLLGAGGIDDLRGDFDKINVILSSLLEPTQAVIDAFSPAMALVDRVGGRSDEKLMEFSIQKARAYAWSVAVRAASAEGEAEQTLVRNVDRFTSTVGRLVAHPRGVMRLATWLVDRFESDAWPAIATALGEVEPDAAF